MESPAEWTEMLASTVSQDSGVKRNRGEEGTRIEMKEQWYISESVSAVKSVPCFFVFR